MGKHYNIPIFIPHAGCPHACIFCNQRAITDTVRAPSIEEARGRIEERLATMSPGSEAEIAYFGGSFTGIDAQEQEAYLRLAREYVRTGQVRGIRISTRPDYIDLETVARLLQFGVTAVELGAQSMHDEVLRKSGRGHAAGDVVRAAELIRRAGMSLGLQVMAGLPGDTPERFLESVRRCADLRPDTMRIYPTVVLRGTELERLYRTGLYVPLSDEEAVSWAAPAVRLCYEQGIRVIRIGLCQEDLMRDGGYVAGPMHPALGELVDGEIVRREVERLLERAGARSGRLVVYAGRRYVSKVIGQRRRNVTDWQERFALERASVKADAALDGVGLLEGFRVAYRRDGLNDILLG